MGERFYYLGFSAFPGIGPLRFGKLLKRFGSAKSAWKSSLKDLKIELGEKTAKKFEEFRAKFSFSNYQKILLREGVSFITIADETYPSLLRQIKNPPFMLYVRSVGASKFFPFNQDKIIAVVGTRRITQYGREVTEIITSELVNAGFTIVSGLAMGVDAVAHKTAIDSGGKTIAVLGSGVDQCYPSANLSLYNGIISSNGAVVSEFPLGETPSKGSFPSRNRIIAGFSQAVLVTEGAEDSGALITADYAFKNNRKVFAVPGPITSSLSKGPHKLILKGAKLINSGAEILKELGIDSKIKNQRANIKNKGNSKEENIILEILENEAVHFDEIVRRSKMNSSQVGSLLSLMEIKGLIKSPSSGIFSITS